MTTYLPRSGTGLDGILSLVVDCQDWVLFGLFLGHTGSIFRNGAPGESSNEGYQNEGMNGPRRLCPMGHFGTNGRAVVAVATRTATRRNQSAVACAKAEHMLRLG